MKRRDDVDVQTTRVTVEARMVSTNTVGSALEVQRDYLWMHLTARLIAVHVDPFELQECDLSG